MTTSKNSRRKPLANQKRPTPKLEAVTKRVVAEKEKVPVKGKITTLVSMMRRPSGASVAELTQETGWQAHSVRGAISGNVKRKLGLRVLSEKVGNKRVYRIPETVKA